MGVLVGAILGSIAGFGVAALLGALSDLAIAPREDGKGGLALWRSRFHSS